MSDPTTAQHPDAAGTTGTNLTQLAQAIGTRLRLRTGVGTVADLPVFARAVHAAADWERLMMALRRAPGADTTARYLILTWTGTTSLGPHSTLATAPLAEHVHVHYRVTVYNDPFFLLRTQLPGQPPVTSGRIRSLVHLRGAVRQAETALTDTTATDILEAQL